MLEYVLKFKQPQSTLLTTVQESTSRFLESTRLTRTRKKKVTLKTLLKRLKNSPPHLPFAQSPVHMIRPVISISTIKKESNVKNVTKKD